MTVPLFDLKRQNKAIEQELEQAFKRVYQSGQFILGPEVTQFEKEVTGLTGTHHAIGVSSGTDALLLALMSLNIGVGDEVVCPDFTFFATAGTIARSGAVPVFADIRDDTCNIDPADIEKKITTRTKAIMPVHLYGQCAEMDAIMEIANNRGIPVIEDAAQSIGAEYKGRKAGSMGAFGAYSFFPTKNLGGLGEGGLLTTNDAALAERAIHLRNHGMAPRYYHSLIGGNFRIDAMQAAFLRVKLPLFDTYTQKRQAHARRYMEAFAPLAQDSQRRLVLPVQQAHCTHIWNQFTVLVLGKGRRDALAKYLTEKNIGSAIYYPVPLHKQECFSDLASAAHSFPVSEKLSQECLSLPIFPELLKEEQDLVIETINSFFES